MLRYILGTKLKGILFVVCFACVMLLAELSKKPYIASVYASASIRNSLLLGTAGRSIFLEGDFLFGISSLRLMYNDGSVLRSQNFLFAVNYTGISALVDSIVASNIPYYRGFLLNFYNLYYTTQNCMYAVEVAKDVAELAIIHNNPTSRRRGKSLGVDYILESVNMLTNSRLKECQPSVVSALEYIGDIIIESKIADASDIMLVFNALDKLDQKDKAIALLHKTGIYN